MELSCVKRKENTELSKMLKMPCTRFHGEQVLQFLDWKSTVAIHVTYGIMVIRSLFLVKEIGIVHVKETGIDMKDAVLTSDISCPFSGLQIKGSEVRVEGLWKDVTGTSWQYSNGNPAALNYAMRSAIAGLPLDDNVYYGKINGLGFLIHESELEFVNS